MHSFTYIFKTSSKRRMIMNIKTGLKRICSIALMVCLLATFVPTVSASAAQDTLQENMEYLVNECGQRLYGTPNEEKAAIYVENKFKEYGYTDVERVKIDQNSVNYTGRLTFKDGAADILGNAYPSTPEKGTFDKITGKLVDLGTNADYAVPTGVTGDIIGAVNFNTAAEYTTANVNAIIEEIKKVDDVSLNGLLITVKDTIKVPSVPKKSTSMDSATVPCVVTTQLFFDKTLANAADFDGMERYTRTQTNAVIATKPASTDDPDAIIIVTSHLDSVLASPGANDNATGISSNLEVAKNLANVDLGNIEVRFAVVGAEEGGGMLGSVYVTESLSAEEKAIALNINMDMLGPGDGAEYYGALLNAVSMDIINYDENGKKLQSLTFNLPAYLVTDEAKAVTWKDDIENVRIYRYGSSDHEKFAKVGIDASSMIVVVDETDDIEAINHTSKDNLQDNYSRECHVMCTQVIENGVLKAGKLELTKKAKVTFTEREADVKATLTNADQLFKLYNKVIATLTAEDGTTQEVTFTKEQKSLTGLAAGEYTISDVKGYATGVADNKDEARNEELKNFTTDLVGVATTGPDPELVPPADDDSQNVPPLGDDDSTVGGNDVVTGDENKTETDVPKTGDNAMVMTWAIVAIAAALGASVTV